MNFINQVTSKYLIVATLEDPSKTTWYHGAGAKYVNLLPGDGIDGPGIYLTKDKRRAEMYAKRDTQGKDRDDFYVHEVKIKVDPKKVWNYSEQYDLRQYSSAPWVAELFEKHGEQGVMIDGQNAKIYLGWDDNKKLKKLGFQALMSHTDLIVLDASIIQKTS